MVRLLIGLRGSIAAHSWHRSAKTPLVLALIVGVISAGGTFWLGFLPEHARGGAGAVVAAVFALWFGGQLAQAALNGGDAGLRPEMLALLPLRPVRLAWSLLLIGLADPVLVLLLVAYAALVPLGVRHGSLPAVVAVLAAALLSLLTQVVATVAAGVLGPGARRGRDLGTMVVALGLAALALCGTLAPTVVDALQHGRARALQLVVRALPSGWGVDAVQAAAAGHPGLAGVWLAALLALTVVAALVWPAILRRRMTLTPHTGHARAGRSRARVLPATPAGAVLAKELRLWSRDPIRLTCLLIAVVVGAGVALIPRLTTGTSLLLPFAGPLTVVIAGAIAGNLYGNDGTSLWLTIMTPGADAADVGGRVGAWLLLVGPFTVVEAVLFTGLSGRPQLWPWSLALELALLGGAAGLLPLASLTAVQPLDAAGNPTPAWSIKVHLALFAVALTGLPALALLIGGALTGAVWLAWLAVPVGMLTGLALFGCGLRWAQPRLATRQVSMLARLRRGA